MAQNQNEKKKSLIDEILRLQQDFQSLTDRQNALQHENQFLQNQLADMEIQLQKKLNQPNQASHSQPETHAQIQWPLYLDIEGDDLPQQPGQFIKFLGSDGQYYVQNLQLIQYVQSSPDGKSKQVVKQEYKVVQQPLEMFQRNHGSFEKFGALKDSSNDNQMNNNIKEGEKDAQNQEKSQQ